MSRFRGRARIDANQVEIVKQLRQAGVSVQPISEIGHGCPDLLVGHQHENWVFEVKLDDGELTEPEELWFGKWRGQVGLIRSAQEALIVMGVAKKVTMGAVGK